MRLTPVILSYNHEGLTEKCLESVLRAFPVTGGTNSSAKPIYLIHNGTRPLVREKLQAKYPQVKHIVIPANMQFSGGANAGLIEAFEDGAEAVLFMSNDTILVNPVLEQESGPQVFASILENHAYGNPAFLLAPRIERRETGQLDSFGAAVNLASGKLTHLREREDANDRTLNEMPKVSSIPPNGATFYVPGAAFVISREAFHRLNGFDERLGSYWEDVDLSLRARRRGVRLGTISEIVIKHGIGKTCHNDPLYTVYYFHRNRRLVAWRHGTKMERLQFSAHYFRDTLGKSFKLLKNKDFSRLKLLLRASIS